MKKEYFSPQDLAPGLFEYLLIARPDNEVFEKIMTEKQFFYNEYGEKVAIKTKPHITIANLLAKEPMEETIIKQVQRVLSGYKSFSVTLNNYSGFPPHTIYLRVQNPQPFHHLANELKVVNSYIRSCSCPPMMLKSNPHISIARRLPDEVYFKALVQYAKKSFHESFMVNELILLRRKHQYDACKTINVFGLQPCSVELSNHY